jgi:hypothetical protein
MATRQATARQATTRQRQEQATTRTNTGVLRFAQNDNVKQARELQGQLCKELLRRHTRLIA